MGVMLCLGTRKGLEVLQELLTLDERPALHVCPLQESHVVESYHDAIGALARQAGLARASWRAFREGPVPYLIQHDIRAILCVGWRYLVPQEAIAHLDGEVIIGHDALLPRYRGFAPLATALIVGESEVGVTFLRAGKGTDDGDILWQRAVPVGDRDTIADLIEKLVPLYREGASLYLRGQLRDPRPQNEAEATYSHWRDEQDLFIDWSESAERIERTIRALGPPYEARTRLGGQIVVLHRAVVEPDLPFAIRYPGKIWQLGLDGQPTVVCGQGLLRILEATVDGKSILPLASLRQRFGP